MKPVRLAILLHRYAGFPMSLLFVLWFASGIVMIYTRGMPDTDAHALSGLRAPVPIDAIRLDPEAAAAAHRIAESGLSLSVINLLERPAYVFGDSSGIGPVVFADDGRKFTGATAAEAAGILVDRLGYAADKINYVATLEQADQWTLTRQSDLPLLRYDIDDGTSVYVSRRTAEIVLVIDRRDKLLAWLGAIPHWLYFTPLRREQPAWYWTVVCLSVAGSAVALLGIFLGFARFRRSRPFRLSDSVRYRGWMRWHYFSGLFFGPFILTWVFSGLLSMEPFDWMRRGGLDVDPGILQGGDLQLTDYGFLASSAGLSTLPAGAHRLELLRILGKPYIRLHARDASGPFLYDIGERRLRDQGFDPEALRWRLQDGLHIEVTSVEWLTEYDDYYYDRDHRLPLPVARIRIADPDQTWLYVDPRFAEIRLAAHRRMRLERWLFNGLHSLDFGFWFDKRPLWDLAVIGLSIGGLASSLIGMLLGFRRARDWINNRTARN